MDRTYIYIPNDYRDLFFAKDLGVKYDYLESKYFIDNDNEYLTKLSDIFKEENFYYELPEFTKHPDRLELKRECWVKLISLHEKHRKAYFKKHKTLQGFYV